VFLVLLPEGASARSGGTPAVFELVREQGRWRLENDYVAERAAFDRQLRAQQGRR
jgi:hypothetical protein